ncbi:hypothetical protein [Paenibacillus amylolyticus]|uniref:Uncharacterized protein n=1 Tax=Paenibacillus amylolyticus TaxID=1451 RepID=A0A100VM27_PAEAM|nr:hypothetical protein [Paenibacillus amylolyticus]GAS82373.1 unknown protein [Paenibacillus amylolyticus]
MDERTLGKIKDDLKVISSNKLNSHQSKLFLVGILHEIILRKDLFPKNGDLKIFINILIVEPIGSLSPFRDYIFLSRTLLASRVSNIILKQFQFRDVIKTVDILNNVLPSSEKIPSNHSKNLNERELDDWMNFIRGNNK